MTDHFNKVKGFVSELGYSISLENETEGVLIINNESAGIQNMVLGLSDPILIMEQFLVELQSQETEVLQSLLQKNRDIVHGALCLDDSGKKVVFRDTLQIENLDLNELEGSLNSLSLLLSEYAQQLLTFSKN